MKECCKKGINKSYKKGNLESNFQSRTRVMPPPKNKIKENKSKLKETKENDNERKKITHTHPSRHTHIPDSGDYVAVHKQPYLTRYERA